MKEFFSIDKMDTLNTDFFSYFKIWPADWASQAVPCYYGSHFWEKSRQYDWTTLNGRKVVIIKYYCTEILLLGSILDKNNSIEIRGLRSRFPRFCQIS